MKKSIVLTNNIKEPSVLQTDKVSTISHLKSVSKPLRGKYKKNHKPQIPLGRRLKRKPLPIIFIQSTLNNTILTLTDKKGNPLAWSSAGKHGFKHSRKKTSYAAQVATTQLAKVCLDKRIRMLEVRMKGLGKGKKTAVSTIKKSGLKIKRLVELTRVPFNGCRPEKKKRRKRK